MLHGVGHQLARVDQVADESTRRSSKPGADDVHALLAGIERLLRAGLPPSAMTASSSSLTASSSSSPMAWASVFVVDHVRYPPIF